jgi:threonine synthase
VTERFEPAPLPWPGVIEAYRHRLTVTQDTPVITLGEGGTPLLESRWLAEQVGRPVFLKCEGANPTGSFKDRGMTLAVSKALQAGAEAVACASTGNTAASAAAYAARAGLPCIVILPSGQVAEGKLAQAIAGGARILPVESDFDAALRLVRWLTDTHQVALVNSLNPHRIDGQQTAAWEVLDALGEEPATQCLPVGNAGNITAYWQGYRTAGAGPRMWGFQAAGAAPIVRGETVDPPETFATAIRIGNPASWQGAVNARDQSGGLIEAVSDEEIQRAWRTLARKEGLFCEPAAAASVAGLLRFAERLPSGPVVCTLTGHGLKDPEAVLSTQPLPPSIPPREEALAEALGWAGVGRTRR